MLLNTSRSLTILSLALLSVCSSDTTASISANSACDGDLTEQRIADQRKLTLKLVRQLQAQRSLSLADLCAIPEKKLQRAIRRIYEPKPDQPGEAMRFRRQQWQDERGVVAEHGLLRAQQQLKRMQKQPLAAGLERGRWQWQGPGNIGGRVRGLLIHPSNPQRLWAGSAGGGIWTTNDGGASWQPVDDFMANLAVASLIMHPSNSDRLYAGTGEGFFNADAIRGAGVFRSDDGGVSWQQLPSTDNSNFHYVNRLAFSANGQTLIAATNRGLFRSTDGGSNWANVTPSTIVDANRFLDLDFHPSDSQKAIAADDDIGVLYSDDGGLTWARASGFGSPERVEIAYARSNPQVIYASAEADNGQIWKSTDGGRSFSHISTPKHTGSQGWYDNAIWVDPSNADRLVVGGIDLWRSTNGGSDFTKFSTWWQAPDSAHADQHIVVSHPQFNGNSNNTVFVGNDGGVYRIDNVFTAMGSDGFTELNNQFGITQFYSVAASPDGKVTGGTQDNGHLVRQNNNENWVDTYGGDGGFAAIDPTDSNYVYGEYVYLEIHRSTNGGGPSSGRQIATDEMTSDGGNFIAPFILDPNNPNTMLAGARQLWRSTNVKATTPSWTSIKPASGTRPISAIAVAPGNSDQIWVGHNNGELYQSRDGRTSSPSWTRIGAGQLPSRYITRIAVDPADHDTVYVAFGGFNSDNLYKSRDGGASWQAITSGLPSAPIRGIAIKPDDNQRIFIGTEVGVFASENAGSSWGLPHDGPANVSVDELAWMNNNTLVAGTHGRGIYRATLDGNDDDSTPDPVTFASQTGVARNTAVQSNTVTVTGIDVPIAIRISNGAYAIDCNGSFTTAAGTVSAGTRLCLRHTSANAYSTETVTTLELGDSRFSFRSVTGGDTEPDAFAFPSQSNVPLDTLITSASITISGLSEATSIRISGGEYAIGCSGSFTSAASSIGNNQRVCVRHRSSATTSSSVTTTLTIGERTGTFTSTTAGADANPEPFSFAAQTGVALASVVQSNSVTITGINVPVTVSVQNGEYSLGCNGSFRSNSGSLQSGQTLCLRHVAAAVPSSSVTTTVQIGERSASFQSTTVAVDSRPDAINFATQRDVALNRQLQSETVTISGINVAVPISIVNGAYSLDCNGSFSTAVGSVTAGRQICLRHTSAGNYASETITTLMVGDSRFDFVSVTKTDDDPDAFSFAPRTGVEPNQLIESAPATITGLINATAISVSGGEYALDCDGNYRREPSQIRNNQRVCLRHQSASTYGSTSTTLLTIGGRTASFQSATLIADRLPEAFSFPSVSNVLANTQVQSATVTVTGINVPVAVSVNNGEFSIGCNGVFRNSPAEIRDGEQLCLRHLAAAGSQADAISTVTVGEFSTTFRSTSLSSTGGLEAGSGGGGGALFLLPLLPLLWQRGRRARGVSSDRTQGD